MWPKALAQLLELLPHVSRLVPIADRFLNAKSADAEANTKAMQQMAEGLRGDLGQVTTSHAGLYRQLNDQSTKLSELSEDLAATHKLLQSAEDRIARLESQSAKLLAVGAGCILLLSIIIVMLILRH